MRNAATSAFSTSRLKVLRLRPFFSLQRQCLYSSSSEDVVEKVLFGGSLRKRRKGPSVSKTISMEDTLSRDKADTEWRALVDESHGLSAPEWLPSFEQLPEAPEYLTQFDDDFETEDASDFEQFAAEESSETDSDPKIREVQEAIEHLLQEEADAIIGPHDLEKSPAADSGSAEIEHRFAFSLEEKEDADNGTAEISSSQNEAENELSSMKVGSSRDLVATADGSTDIAELAMRIPYDEKRTFDLSANCVIFPPQCHHKIVPPLCEVPGEYLPDAECTLPANAEEAANWPVPPWTVPGFVQPLRHESAMASVSKYPELFQSETGSHALAETSDSELTLRALRLRDAVAVAKASQSSAAQLRDSDANRADFEMAKKESMRDAFDKRKEDASRKRVALCLVEDDSMKNRLRIIAVLLMAVLFYKWRIKPEIDELNEPLRHRLERLNALNIEFRDDGDLKHEDLLGHLQTDRSGRLFVTPQQTETGEDVVQE